MRGENRLNRFKEKDDCLLWVYTLGRFEIYVGEELVTRGYKRSNRMWNLFKYILSNKERPLSPDELIENLWRNDETKSNLPKSLQNLIFRLRHCLKVDGYAGDLIIFTKGCYKWNEEYPAWVDCEALEDAYRRGVEYEETSLPDARQCFEKVVSLYGGEYFNDMFYTGWIYIQRVKYQNMYIECVTRLVGIMERAGNYEAVLRVCSDAFKIEKYDSNINLMYIKALYMARNAEEALNWYEYITEAMYREYGLRPSEEYKTLLRLISNEQSCTRFDGDGVMSAISEDITSKGALICDKETFIAVNRVFVRNIERSGISVMIIPISIKPKCNCEVNCGATEDIISATRDVIAHSLRRSDAICLWGEGMLCLMLTNLSFEDAERIMGNMKIRLEEQVLKGGYTLASKIYPLEKL